MELRSKYPTLGDDDIIHYKITEPEIVDGIYLPAGSFITAYAREKTIRTSQEIRDYSLQKYGKDLYYYSDTDSVHTGLTIEELKQFCDIDNVKLGAWKCERKFHKSKVYKAKMLFRRNRRKNGDNMCRNA